MQMYSVTKKYFVKIKQENVMTTKRLKWKEYFFKGNMIIVSL